MMNQSRQSRRYCCPGGYAGIMGYGLAYWGADPRLCGREACASARSTSWGVRPLDSRKLTRCEIGELCTLGSAKNDTALCIISVRAGVETSDRAGAAGAFESAMLSVVLQPRRRPTRRATCVPRACTHGPPQRAQKFCTSNDRYVEVGAGVRGLHSLFTLSESDKTVTVISQNYNGI